MPQRVSLVLSGGIALGAYQGGAYSVLDGKREFHPERLVGSSIGAVNAAIIAGNPPDRRTECLRRFWSAFPIAVAPPPTGGFDLWRDGWWRHALNWASVMQARLFGVAGAFRTRLPGLMVENVTSLYDLAPLRGRLEELVDFDRLNGGDVRVSVSATDIETGEEIVFDTHRGDRIGLDHLMASCGFLPDFAPVEIDGRLLGDGALVANAPIEAALSDEAEDGDLLCFVIDLFCAHGRRPVTLEDAAARRWDLIFGNQSRQTLRRLEREIRLRRLLRALDARLLDESPARRDIDSALTRRVPGAITVYYLGYQPARHEAGAERPFDFSPGTLADRWRWGRLDMADALRRAGQAEQPTDGIAVHRVIRSPSLKSTSEPEPDRLSASVWFQRM